MDTDAPLVNLEDHPRIIPFGKMLRATGIDYLPQLFNVLRGDMSIVGPRPCYTYEKEKYLSWYHERFDVPPGLTGLWQVSGKYRLTFQQMMRLDISYVRNMSLWLDIKIILKTPLAVLWDWNAVRKEMIGMQSDSSISNPEGEMATRITRDFKKDLSGVFISYCHSDRKLAKTILDRLFHNNISVWARDADLKGNYYVNLDDSIEQAINNASYLILLLTPSSIKSSWVRHEWQLVLEKSWENPKKKILPILFADVAAPAFLLDRPILKCKSLEYVDNILLDSLVRIISSHAGTVDDQLELLSFEPNIIKSRFDELFQSAEEINKLGAWDIENA
jgi:hypothetical protein